MMYALDFYRYEYENDSVGELIRTEFFDTLDEAMAMAEAFKFDDVRLAIVKTTGEPGDEGEVVAEY